MSSSRVFVAALAVLVAALVASVFLWPRRQGVTVCCAADQEHASKILEAFERETGIQIRDVKYDDEANKTVGSVAVLRLTKDEPRFDVFWNNEPLHTMKLAEEGIFEPYESPEAADIPAEFRDPQARWTGFAARARVLIVNTDLVGPDERPSSMDDLLDPRWKGRVAIARPLAGTTLTHAAVLWTVLGRDRTLAWFRGLHENDVVFPAGNGPLATAVGMGQIAWGFTDTDDFRKQEVEDPPRHVVRVFPDQGDGQPGTLVLPNTVALVKGAPEPELGKRLIDYLLRKETEAALAQSDGAHIPLRAGVVRPDHVQGPPRFRAMKVDWKDVANHFEERLSQLQALWE